MFLSLRRKKSIDLYRESLLLLSKQISETIKNGKWTNINKLQRPITSVVVNGMGGSNLGPEIINSLLKKNLSVPVIIEPGYEVSGYVNKDTAYIVSTYSGTTEEPLAAYTKARKRGALVISLTAGGGNKLSKLARQNRTPLFEFPTSANPSNQPRLGLGAALTGCIMIFVQLNVLKKTVIKDLANFTKKLSKNNKILLHRNGPAAQLARQIKGREIVLISGPLFAGNLKALRNQLCESAKNIGQYLIISDMNHFALEGLSNPQTNYKHLAVIFIESKLDSPKIQKRLELTKEIFKKNRIPTLSHSLNSKTIIEQGLELLQFGSFLSYYVSINNHVDPMNIPWVDWFKKKLATK